MEQSYHVLKMLKIYFFVSFYSSFIVSSSVYQRMSAEGSANPYWCDEAVMVKRVEFLKKKMSIQKDASSIAMFVAKSNNDKCVIYKWDNSRSVLKPCWLSFEDQSIPEGERSELNALETMLYGSNLSVKEDGTWEITLSAEAISHRIMNLTLSDKDEPTLTGVVNGRLGVIEFCFVVMKKGLIPDVEKVYIHGRDVRTREKLEEIIHN
jgi:hypothetical protein